MTSKRRILVVEDEPLIAMDIEAELEGRGWEVVGSVGTTPGALQLLDAEPIAVALLDINLRGDTSYEIAEALEQRNIPFVFLSGDDGESRPEHLKSRQLLSKPINYGQLHDALRGETNKASMKLRSAVGGRQGDAGRARASPNTFAPCYPSLRQRTEANQPVPSSHPLKGPTAKQ